MKWILALLLTALAPVASAAKEPSHGEPAPAAAAHGDAAHADAAHAEPASTIPWGKMTFHALNLAILLGIIGWFARKPIKDAIADRSLAIKKDMDEINALRKQANDRYAEIETRLQGYDRKLAEMKGDAEKEAAAEAREIAARAERDAQVIQQAAERTIRDETLRARHALRKDAVELAVKIAEEQLRLQITEADQRRLATDFLRTVEGNGNG
jgi:F-type H+-transporting ATPase subunit b